MGEERSLTNYSQQHSLTANFVQTHHKHGKMKKLKEVNKIWQHIRWIYAKEY
jgi:hypothetical protein